MVNDLQEQIADLEKHRTHTESSTKTSVTEIVDLKSQLQAAESAKKMYEEELKELRAQQEDHVEEAVVPAVTSAPSQEQREKTMRLEIENKQLQEEVAALKAAAAVTAASKVAASDDGNSAELSKEIKQLQEQLDTKEKENAKISSDKDKLEAYTKRTLAKFQDKYLVALQECKAKLKEKQDKIEVLEQRSASERTAQKREERLLSSTIYELGLAIMQNRLKSGSGS
jgi:protein HOOK3